MRIEDINRHREKFLHNIQTSLEPELTKIGLVLINVNITDITDESGYIEAIGKKAASQAVQQAKIDVAAAGEAGHRSAWPRPSARRPSRSPTPPSSREIGTREASANRPCRMAQLDKEQKIGEQTAAFEREAQVKDAERDDAHCHGRRQRQGHRRRGRPGRGRQPPRPTLQVKQAEAYQLGETRKREAEAAVQEAQNRAMAKAALAQAERVEAERRAAVEAPAKAEKAQGHRRGRGRGRKAPHRGRGPGAAIFAKLDAEASGNYEILAKKGEGLRQIIEACGGVAAGVPDADAGAPGHAGRNRGQGDLQHQVRQGGRLGGRRIGQRQRAQQHDPNFLQSMARAMPPMMQVMKDIGGVEMPEYIARLNPESLNGEIKPAKTEGNR